MISKYCDFQGSTCLKSRDVGADVVVCCKTCHRHEGYFEDLDETFPEEHRHLFVEDYGFLTSIGCTLPYEDRSTTCTDYFCGRVKDKMK